MAGSRISRREFLKETGAGAVGVGVALPFAASAVVDYTQAVAVDRKQLVAALADTIIPTANGYPGYRRLEQYGITDEVLKGLTGIRPDEYNTFNAAAQEFFPKPFLDLNELDRAAFLEIVADSFPPQTWDAGSTKQSKGASAQLYTKLNKDVVEKIQKVFRMTRLRVLTIFYQNFPENKIARDKNRIPILRPGDTHQILDPNTPVLVTGWDVANFRGPLSWQEEESRRAKWMKIHWHKD
ncbi:MAG: twin-arginine translocation signal domain-containing protein [Acidobacteria bacterium]|nr:twin-arginine translocation signal domain-containing protein [Acidobacteriota bacterium]